MSRSIVWVAALFATARLAAGGEPEREESIGGLRDAIARARESVFPTLIHIEPVFDRSSGGRKFEASATGSGVIIREDGLAVTNYHVAGTAKRMQVTLSDRRKLPARLVGKDAATDLALVQLEIGVLGLDRIACAQFAATPPVEGDFVIAMGSPLGLTRSLSFGVVSCAKRYLGELRIASHIPTGLFNTWIQTDAAINPGNSGGPLVALDGHIVGINSRGFDRADNLGFAIPAEVVCDVIGRILADVGDAEGAETRAGERIGRVVRSEIGVSIQAVPEGAVAAGGALVASVDPGSPAEKAGLRAGDVLLAYAGTPLDVRFVEDLPGALRVLTDARVGAAVELIARRDAREIRLSATTVEWKPPQEEDTELAEHGLTLRALGDAERRELFLDREGAVLVTGARAGGAAKRSFPPITAGDAILEIDGAPVAVPADVAAALDRARESGSLACVLVVARGRGEWRIALEVDRKDPEVAVRATGGLK